LQGISRLKSGDGVCMAAQAIGKSCLRCNLLAGGRARTPGSECCIGVAPKMASGTAFHQVACALEMGGPESCAKPQMTNAIRCIYGRRSSQSCPLALRQDMHMNIRPAPAGGRMCQGAHHSLCRPPRAPMPAARGSDATSQAMCMPSGPSDLAQRSPLTFITDFSYGLQIWIITTK
jgi:hypothetical protein